MNTAFFIVTVIVIFVLFWHGMLKSKRRLTRRFENRKDLSFDDFYRKFYTTSTIEKHLIEELLNHVAAELDLPISKLLPTDRFDTELAPDKGWNWDSGHGILAGELQKLAKKKGQLIDLEKILTLDDYLKVAATLW